MSIIDRNDNRYWRNMMVRTLLVVVSVLLIVWFLPRDSQGQKFRYDVGKPWMYQSFIAQFDFPIYKTEEAVMAEQDSLMETIMPYYNYNPDEEKVQIEKFKQDFAGSLPHSYINIISDRLHRLYQAGIMSTAEYKTIAKDSTQAIRVVTGKNAASIEIGCVYSTMSAYKMLLDDETLSKDRALLQKCNLNNYIEPNLKYDKERTEGERNDMLSSIPLASGMVMSGQKIIDRGEIVDDYTYRVLSSFEREMQRRSATEDEMTTTIIGQTIFVSMLVLLFTMYIALFRKDYFEKPRSIMMLYVMITVFPIIVSLMMKHNLFSVYIIKTALLVTLGSCAVFFAMQMMQETDVVKLDIKMYTHFAVNGVLLLLSYPLMYLIEKMFGFTSNVTLFELSNTFKGLLRNLSEVAPGTFQHSITVGNLAAEVANRIGADSLLVRVGALYHDIGKMTNPAFFTENQAGINPHENLQCKESARIIIEHVTEGVKLAEKANLPTIIKDFILTHHGRGVAKYFYIKYQNEHPEEVVDKEQFTYPGPNPFTREQALLMMADTCEAASRSLTEYTEESISTLVNRLIDGQVADGFFTDCPITFRDISQAKLVLIERLMSIYHTRIQYPEPK